MSRVAFSVGVCLELAEGWLDITRTLDGDPPLTLAREDGVGALQFSVGLYRGGAAPHATIEHLLSMLHSCFREKMLGDLTDVRTTSEPLLVAGGTSLKEGVVRVWYVSDGSNFAFVTYTSDSEAPSELEHCEKMIRSIQFEGLRSPTSR